MDHHTALEAANQALSTRNPKLPSPVPEDLRDIDPKTGAWELAGMTTVALATLTAVVALWLA